MSGTWQPTEGAHWWRGCGGAGARKPRHSTHELRPSREALSLDGSGAGGWFVVTLLYSWVWGDGGREWGRGVLGLAYGFVRLTTGISGRCVTAPDEALRATGLALQRCEFFNGGMLHADIWAREEVEMCSRLDRWSGMNSAFR